MSRRPHNGWVTNDPTTADSRIFVGNLPLETTQVMRQALEDQFKPYGLIQGITVFKTYGFVQFSDPREAQEAIRCEQGLVLLGKPMQLKRAVAKNGDGGPDDRGSDYGGVDNDMRGRGRPPVGYPDEERRWGGPPARGFPPQHRADWPGEAEEARRRYDDWAPDRKRPRHDVPWSEPGGPRPDMDRPPQHRYPDDPYMERDRAPGPPHPGRYPSEYEEERYGGYPPARGHGGPPAAPAGVPPSAGGGYPRTAGGVERRSSAAAPERDGAAVKNDCELVVLDRQITRYAEHVEIRLKNLGMRVDMLFPRAGAPVAQILDDINARGVLYGIVIHPSNEEHRSVSLNILHTAPTQEHRNMPLDDAMALLARDYESRSAPTPGVDRSPPRAIINLMEFVRDNRPLTAVEYNRLIRYLEERRDDQLKPENPLGPAPTEASAPQPVPGPPAVSANSGVQQLDLQQKILSMMEQYKPAAGVPAPTPVAAPRWPAEPAAAHGGYRGAVGPVQPPSGATRWSAEVPASQGGGFGGATVNRALDSLITSGPNLLKHAGAAGEQPARQPPRADGWYDQQQLQQPRPPTAAGEPVMRGVPPHNPYQQQQQAGYPSQQAFQRPY